MASSKFDAKNYIAELEQYSTEDPSLTSNDQSVNRLRRTDLVCLYKELALSGVQSNAVKREFLKTVVWALNEKNLVSDKYADSFDDEEVSKSKDQDKQSQELELERLRLETQERKEKRELELRRLELEQEREKIKIENERLIKEREAQAKIELLSAEARIKQAEADRIEAQTRAFRGAGVDPSDQRTRRTQSQQFDPSRVTKLVPHFNERDLEAYFQSFEHTAQTLNWPGDSWTILLSTVLKGKAQTVYANLSPLEKIDYVTVKAAVLKAYEEVPEKYRAKFRFYKKKDEQSYVDFVKEKERLFEKWRKSREADTLEKVTNLILLEDFKNSVPKAVRMHIEDLDIVDAQKAARKADDYAIVHRDYSQGRSNGQNPSNGQNQGQGYKSKYKGPRANQNGGLSTQNAEKGSNDQSSKLFCHLHKSAGHSTEDCHTMQLLKSRGVPVNMEELKKSPSVDRFSNNEKTQKGKWKGDSKSQVQNVGFIMSSSDLGLPGGESLSEVHNAPSVARSESQSSTPSLDMLVELKNDCASCTDNEIDSRFANFVKKATIANVPMSKSETSCGQGSEQHVDLYSTQLQSEGVAVNALRDTGSSQSLVKKGGIGLAAKPIYG